MSFKVSFVFLFMACFGKLDAKLSCPDVSDGDEVYLPSDTNCGEYFHCVNGVPIEMKCPMGSGGIKQMNFVTGLIKLAHLAQVNVQNRKIGQGIIIIFQLD